MQHSHLSAGEKDIWVAPDGVEVVVDNPRGPYLRVHCHGPENHLRPDGSCEHIDSLAEHNRERATRLVRQQTLLIYLPPEVPI